MRTISQFIPLLLFTFFASISSAQQVDTMTIDGEEIFVYPFKAVVNRDYPYWEIKERPKQSKRLSYKTYLEQVTDNPWVADSMIFTKNEFNIYKKIIKAKSYEKLQELYFPKLGEIPTEEEFDLFYEMGRNSRKSARKYKRQGLYEDEAKYIKNKKFVKAARANPYPLLLQSAGQNKDLTPSLDPIPDGKYIQLYDMFCLVDEDGKCNYMDTAIAAYFTIKNNLLEGEAVWVGLQGDTLKHGWFSGGLKVGKWKFVEYDLGYMDEYQAQRYIDFGAPRVDTSYAFIEYQEGAMNGKYAYYESSDFPIVEGHYKDDEQVGEWIHRPIQYYFIWDEKDTDSLLAPQEIPIRHNSQITLKYTYNTDDSLLVKPIVMRNGLYSVWHYDDLEFNFNSSHALIQLPDDKYAPGFERQEELDLAEEENDIRDIEYNEYGEEYYEFGYEQEYVYGGGSEYGYERDFYRLDNDSVILRGVLFDSIGAYPKYLDTYEAYYPNGQLAYKYEFENGRMKEEPTVYWATGIVHDEVNFVADSNAYERKIYDITGKLYNTIWYDSLGDMKEDLGDELWEPNYIVIDGYKMIDYEYGNYVTYNAPDSLLLDSLMTNFLYYKTWNKLDSSLLWEGYFDPVSRTRTNTSFAVDGSIVSSFENQFSEDFMSWTGKSYDNFEKFKLETTESASYSEWAEPDSIPVRQIDVMYGRYSINSDYTLFYGDEPMTGPLELNLDAKKLRVKKGALVDIPFYNQDVDKLEKNFDKYLKTGKAKNALELSIVNSADFRDGSSAFVWNNIFTGVLSNFFDRSTYLGNNDEFMYYDDYDYYEEDEVRVKKKDENSRIVSVEGTMFNGKPNGTWTSFDQFGKRLVVVPFDQGVANGRVEFYNYQEAEQPYDLYSGQSEMADSMPAEKTYYLSRVENYVNGKREGKSTEYNWLGDITSESEYKDGAMHGKSIDRTTLAYSEAEYKYGYLDGYMRTYLTLPEQDSLLLYDLLFQEGALQGESKSYHTNGKISKRGFFLSGDPIDDYEGFDSLGFRYHYVKFQYSYPIEEKIWEENELSVRYQFDWQDSIAFIPIDITESESLQSLLVRLGYGDDYLYRPYYGRPSLVEKGGIDYKLTKYYPNDSIARDGTMSNGRKSGHWDYYSYEGEHLYSVDYFDSIIALNDSVRFSSKGRYIELDVAGDTLYESYIIEKFERYDCSHSDHYETRQLYTIWEANDSLNRMNGEVINFYDNGTLQSRGFMKNGLPHGEWRFYDPNGKLNKYGIYTMGKRNGRWLSGDLSKTKYIGEICLNPNMPDIEEEIRYRENFLDIEVINYKLGKTLNSQYYDINMNQFIDLEEEELEEEEFEE